MPGRFTLESSFLLLLLRPASHPEVSGWGVLGLTAPKMEAQEVRPGGSRRLIYLGILAHTILRIVFSAFLSFPVITGWFNPFKPTEGEMHTHATNNLNTSDLSCTVKTKYTSKHKTWPMPPCSAKILHRLCSG